MVHAEVHGLSDRDDTGLTDAEPPCVENLLRGVRPPQTASIPLTPKDHAFIRTSFVCPSGNHRELGGRLPYVAGTVLDARDKKGKKTSPAAFRN